MNVKDIFQTVVAVGVVGAMVLGAISYFATAEDLRITQNRLEQKIQTDVVIDLQRRMWQLEERNKASGSDCSKWKDERDRKEYKELVFQLEMTKKKLEGK